jgi:WD40 repeat protein
VAKNQKAMEKDLPVAREALADLAVTSDRKALITIAENGEVKIWDLGTRQAKHTFICHKEKLTAFVLSPDGSRFATAGNDNVIKLWDTATGMELRSWDMRLPPPTRRDERGFIRALAFSADGKSLVSANADTTAYLLELP